MNKKWLIMRMDREANKGATTIVGEMEWLSKTININDKELGDMWLYQYQLQNS